MFIASAEKVVDMMLMPAIPGTMTSRSLWLLEKIAPKSDRKMSGSRKLKKAALAVFLVAGVVCFAAMGVALSHAIPNFDSAPAYVNAIFLPIIFISGVFYDAGNAPVFLRDIAEVLPLIHLIDGLSAALVTGASLADHLSDLAVVLVWAALGIFLAVRGFSWEARRG